MKKRTRAFEVVPVAVVLETARPIEDEEPVPAPSQDAASPLLMSSENLNGSGDPKNGEN
jgi:hypothetical protein